MRSKILIAKPGLDGHDRGAHIVCNALKEAGFDVQYTGIRKTSKRIAEIALQGGVSIVGISCLSGNHVKHFKDVADHLKDSDIKIIGGGIIPKKDITLLMSMGVRDIFTPGTPMKTIIDKIKQLTNER